MLKTGLAVALVLGSAAGARAQALRDYCPERPGLGTASCIVDAGHASVETSLADAMRDRGGGETVDTIVAGEAIARLGIGPRTEVRLGWTAYGHERTRVRGGDTSHDSGVGDLLVGMKYGLRNPDGSGLSIALLPFATLPVGRSPAGAGDWGAGLVLPMSFELSDTLSASFTGQAEAAVDEDRNGRHLAYTAIGGLTVKPVDALAISGEISLERDRDPGGHATIALAGLSAGWLIGESLQLDAGANAGLNPAAPDIQLYLGISRRF